MKLRPLGSLSLLLLPFLAAEAGDYTPDPKQPIRAKEVIEECLDLGAEISTGYRTDQFIHGIRINRDAMYVDVNYRFESLVPFTLGVEYSSGLNEVTPFDRMGPIDLTNLYLRAEVFEFAGFDFDVSYTQRYLHLPIPVDLNGSYGDVGFHLSRDFGFATLLLESTLGLNSRNSFFDAGGGDGWIHHAGLIKEFALSENADLVLSGGVGYHDGYFVPGPGTHGWSHYYVEAALPLQLNCRTTLTPYIGYNGSQWGAVFAPQGDILHAGVSLSVSF